MTHIGPFSSGTTIDHSDELPIYAGSKSLETFIK
jgi:hypothetical protein